MTGRKTLIMGATGHVGRLLRGVWRGRGDVVWQARAGADVDWALAAGAGALAPALAGVGTVVCLAGATPGPGPGPGQRARPDFDLNVALARAALEAAALAGGGATVFLASSIAVYGPGTGPFREDDPCRPDTGYGRSKLAMEAAAAGSRAVALRLGNVVGADMLFRNVAAGRPIAVERFADGATPRRSYIDPETLARALDRLAALAAGGAALPPVLNLAGAPPAAMGDLLVAAGIAHDRVPAGPGARPLVAMDVARAAALVPDLARPRDAAALVAGWRRAVAA